MKKRVGGTEQFEFEVLKGDKHLHVTIAISGWCSGQDDAGFGYPWEAFDDDAEQYCLKWDGRYLRELDRSLKTFTKNEGTSMVVEEGIKFTAIKVMTQSITWPLALLTATYVIDNPWGTCAQRAREAGSHLAEVLVERHQGYRPVNLIGCSLGARVIFYCLLEMSAKTGCEGIVQDVHLIGTPIFVNESKWESLEKVVSGKLVNCYSRYDWLLQFVFRAASIEVGNIAGLGPVHASWPRLINLDITDKINNHADYGDPEKMAQVLKLLGFKTKELKLHNLFDRFGSNSGHSLALSDSKHPAAQANDPKTLPVRTVDLISEDIKELLNVSTQCLGRLSADLGNNGTKTNEGNSSHMQNLHPSKAFGRQSSYSSEIWSWLNPFADEGAKNQEDKSNSEDQVEVEDKQQHSVHAQEETEDTSKCLSDGIQERDHLGNEIGQRNKSHQSTLWGWLNVFDTENHKRDETSECQNNQYSEALDKNTPRDSEKQVKAPSDTTQTKDESKLPNSGNKSFRAESEGIPMQAVKLLEDTEQKKVHTTPSWSLFGAFSWREKKEIEEECSLSTKYTPDSCSEPMYLVQEDESNKSTGTFIKGSNDNEIPDMEKRETSVSVENYCPASQRQSISYSSLSATAGMKFQPQLQRKEESSTLIKDTSEMSDNDRLQSERYRKCPSKSPEQMQLQCEGRSMFIEETHDLTPKNSQMHMITDIQGQTCVENLTEGQRAVIDDLNEIVLSDDVTGEKIRGVTCIAIDTGNSVEQHTLEGNSVQEPQPQNDLKKKGSFIKAAYKRKQHHKFYRKNTYDEGVNKRSDDDDNTKQIFSTDCNASVNLNQQKSYDTEFEGRQEQRLDYDAKEDIDRNTNYGYEEQNAGNANGNCDYPKEVKRTSSGSPLSPEDIGSSFAHSDAKITASSEKNGENGQSVNTPTLETKEKADGVIEANKSDEDLDSDFDLSDVSCNSLDLLDGNFSFSDEDLTDI